MICKTYLGLIGVMVTATGAWAGGKTVGTTKDSCDADNVVKFATKDGTAQVKNDQQEHRFEMLGMLREFHWYCAGSRERVANAEQFNVVVIRRAKNGAISWTFVLDNGASGGTSGQSGGQVGGTTETVTPPGLIRVGDSRDACDASHPVFVKDVSGLDVTIKANQLRFVAGSVKACVSLSGGTATCNFRADPAPPSARPTIGTSGDQCGQGSLWLWDAERATFVRIKKGEKAIHVEVENNRFEWYCGGDTSPDVTNQEWASGPLATRAVSVTRPTKNSPAITWKFESYK